MDLCRRFGLHKCCRCGLHLIDFTLSVFLRERCRRFGLHKYTRFGLHKYTRCDLHKRLFEVVHYKALNNEEVESEIENSESPAGDSE
jgi:hypothetical protein